MQQPPAAAGIDLANWNWNVVRAFGEGRFERAWCRSRCLNSLHRLGFVLRRPKQRLTTADAAKRGAFVRRYAERRRAAQQTGARIWFVDEAHFRADADLRGRWVRKGAPALVDSSRPSLQEQVVSSSAVCLATGEVEQMAGDGNGTAETSAAFLRQLRAKHPEALRVIWDHGPAQRGEPIRPSLATAESRVRVVPLPGYRPDDHADEAIWDWIREDVTANTCLGTTAKVREQVDAFLQGLGSRTDEVRQRCRTLLQAHADALDQATTPACSACPHGDPPVALLYGSLTARSDRKEGSVESLTPAALLAAFATIPDPRRRQGTRYPLPAILALAIAAISANHRSVLAIAEWGASQSPALLAALGFPGGVTPPQATLARLFRRLDPGALSAALTRYFAGDGRQAPVARGGQGVAVDGKAQRGRLAFADAPDAAVHALNAFCHEHGVVLAQVPIDSTAEQAEAELTAAPRLVARLDWRGRVLTGDDLLLVKEHQPTRYADLRDRFDPPFPAPPLPGDRLATAATLDQGHGRLERRTLTRSAALNGVLAWPDVGQVLRRHYRAVDLATGRVRQEVRYA
ncbi:MAG TPA: transposase family protein, partial [Thermomicrobiales bacterium]|nr:transposase family protein [Thermomicrobiales bacterium]